MKDDDEDPIGLAEELPPKDGVRVFRVPVGQLVALAQREILRGLGGMHASNPRPVKDELLPLLEQCAILGPAAFDLVTTPKMELDHRLWGLRARALDLCRRWYIARLHKRLDNNPVILIFPHAEGWQE